MEENTMNDTQVMTNMNGTVINMDTIAAKNMLIQTAITTLTLCKEVEITKESGRMECSTDSPTYEGLINHYCPGNRTDIILSLLQQNAELLYCFIEDCVTNNTVNGLYLLTEFSKCNVPAWKVIVDALDGYVTFVHRFYDILGKEAPNIAIKYNKYNKEFSELMNK